MTTKRILTERIGKMTGDTDGFPDEQFYALNVRGQTPEERVDMLTLAIKTYEPDMVVIDGIADLMGDINSGPDSTKLIQQLLGMATEHKCNITAIIHLNRTGERLNLRGWIGTVMVQKSYEVLNCDKVSKTQTFSADLTFSRRFHQKQTFYYTIDEEGLPETAEKPDVQPQKKPQGQEEPFNQKYIVRHEYLDKWEWDLNGLFADAIGNRAVVGRDELQRQVMTLANIRVPKYYDNLFQKALDEHLIKTTLDRSGRVVVVKP